MAEKLMLLVQKGCLVPADGYTRETMRERGYHIGDVLSADLRKPRNPGYHRLAHAFGRLCAENIEAFTGLSAHSVLKRIQLEGNIGCDEMALNFPGIGPCVYRIPRSLSFASMEQGEFEGIYRAMCEYVAKTYWEGLSEDQVAALAETMAEAA